MLVRGLTALAVCALVLSVVGSAKHPVDRPFKASGIVTHQVSNPDYSGSMEVAGTATHLGKFASKAHWVFDYSTFTLHVWADFTAANGDTLQAEFLAWEVDPVTGISDSGVATITGGTGRFAHASGSYVATFSGANLEIFTVEGTISY